MTAEPSDQGVKLVISKSAIMLGEGSKPVLELPSREILHSRASMPGTSEAVRTICTSFRLPTDLRTLGRSTRRSARPWAKMPVPPRPSSWPMRKPPTAFSSKSSSRWDKASL